MRSTRTPPFEARSLDRLSQSITRAGSNGAIGAIPPRPTMPRFLDRSAKIVSRQIAGQDRTTGPRFWLHGTKARSRFPEAGSCGALWITGRRCRTIPWAFWTIIASRKKRFTRSAPTGQELLTTISLSVSRQPRYSSTRTLPCSLPTARTSPASWDRFAMRAANARSLRGTSCCRSPDPLTVLIL